MVPRVVRTRPPARTGLRQRKNESDLNSAPPGVNQNQEGTSAQVLPQIERPSLPPLVIDLEATDDDVVICSPRAVSEVCLNLTLHISLLWVSLHTSTYIKISV